MQSLRMILPLLILAATLHAGGKRPDWVKSTPVDPAFYTGIGSSQKTNPDYRESAKLAALADISSQLMVTLSSEFLDKLSEKNDTIKEEVQSTIRSQTKAKLEGYEQAAVWEDGKEYWVHYRLSKAKYEAAKKLKLQRATDLGLANFTAAKAAEEKADAAAALSAYIQGFSALQEYLAEPVQASYKGASIFLVNEIFTGLQTVLNQTSIVPTDAKIEGKVGQALKKPLEVRLVYKSSPVVNAPVAFGFQKGAGTMIGSAASDQSGVARTTVTAVTATDKAQMVRVALDMNRLMPDTGSLACKILTGSLVVPEAKITLAVSSLVASFDDDETLFGEPMEVKYLEPKLKDALTTRGFTFVSNGADADVIIKIKAASRKGSEIEGLFVAFVDLTISVIDQDSKQEVYKNSLNNRKGIQADFRAAGLKAYENAAKDVAGMIPDMIQKMQR